jgi:hypothetical protein
LSPTTLEEVKWLGWEGLDVILATGDSYITTLFIGTAMIGKLLVNLEQVQIFTPPRLAYLA